MGWENAKVKQPQYHTLRFVSIFIMKLNKHYLSMLHSCPKLVSCMLFAIKFILKSQDDTSETLVLFSLGLSVLTTAA